MGIEYTMSILLYKVINMNEKVSENKKLNIIKYDDKEIIKLSKEVMDILAVEKPIVSKKN